MKQIRLFLLCTALFLFLLCLVSCDFGAFLPGGTTAATTTAGGTTTAPVSTTAAPITTTEAPVTTTAPPEVSENPIKSVSLSANGQKLIVKYQNNTTQNLVTEVALREGYNSARLISYDFDTDARVLALTYGESAALNRAEIFLESAKPTITLYVREMNGKLQFCRDPQVGGWTDFANAEKLAAVNGVPILTKLLNDVEYGKTDPDDALGTGTVFSIKQEERGQEQENSYTPGKKQGAYLRFRAKEWVKDGYDMVTDARLFGSKNWAFNMLTMDEIEESLPNNSMTAGTTFKSSGDDVTPLNFNGAYMGGNHGYDVVSAIPVSGLTEEDIGSIWQCGAQKYVLVKVDYASSDTGNAPMAWFCPYDPSAMQSGIFTYKAIASGATLTHVSGAAHTASITATQAGKRCQFLVAVNHLEQHVFLNGKVEVSLEDTAAYEADFVDFHESYDVIYLPAILTYLIENVGSNNNLTHFGEEINEAYVTMDITYRFHKNGACVIYTDYHFQKDIKFHQLSGIQSYQWHYGLASDYVYIPGTTNLNTPTLHEKIDRPNGVTITWGHGDLAKPSVPTSSYFQLSDAVGTKSMNVGYYPLFGDALPERRLELTGNTSPFGQKGDLLKMYPNLARSEAGSTLTAGTHISFISYRLPSVATDPDFIAENWYWVGDEIILSLHTQELLTDKEVTLPDYMNGMEISLIEGSSTLTVHEGTVENGKITVSSEDIGYVILRLSPAE